MIVSIIIAFVSISVIIIVHELGHYFACRWGGVRVEALSLGFGKRLIGKKIGDTDYRISAIPFGGFCKMAGENPDDVLKGDPYEFPSKPIPIRIMIVAMGPIFNLVFGFLLFWIIFMLGVPEFKEYFIKVIDVLKNSPAEKAGLVKGDRIISIADAEIKENTAIKNLVGQHVGRNVGLIVDRDGRLIELGVVPRYDAGEKKVIIGIMHSPPMPKVVSQIATVRNGSYAEKAGFLKDDIIVGIDNIAAKDWVKIEETIMDNPDKLLTFKVERNKRMMEIQVKPQAQTVPTPEGDNITIGRIEGMTPKMDKIRRNPAEALYYALLETKKDTVFLYVVLKDIFIGRVSTKNLAGPIGIIQVIVDSTKSGLDSFLRLLAFISINLMIVNLLPIPIADGGVIVVTIIEAIRRKPMSIKKLEIFYKAGLAFLIFVFLYVTFNDVQRIFHLGQKKEMKTVETDKRQPKMFSGETADTASQGR